MDVLKDPWARRNLAFQPLIKLANGFGRLKEQFFVDLEVEPKGFDNEQQQQPKLPAYQLGTPGPIVDQPGPCEVKSHQIAGMLKQQRFDLCRATIEVKVNKHNIDASRMF